MAGEEALVVAEGGRERPSARPTKSEGGAIKRGGGGRKGARGGAVRAKDGRGEKGRKEKTAVPKQKTSLSSAAYPPWPTSPKMA